MSAFGRDIGPVHMYGMSHSMRTICGLNKNKGKIDVRVKWD
jgi:hypothetical protein